MSYKKIVPLLIVALVLVFIFTDRRPEGAPTNMSFQYSVEEVLADLEPLQELARNSKPNPDIYASCYYKPDHYLYKGLLGMQGYHSKGKGFDFTPYAEKDDPEGTFWEAEAILGTNIFSGGQSYPLFLKSMELGFPYAAFRFNSEIYHSDCKWYLGSYCDDKELVARGKQMLKKLADTGDFNTQYYLASADWDRKTHDENFRAFLPMLIEGVKRHKYNDLMSIILEIDRYADKFIDEDDITDEHKRKIVNLLLLMVDNNYLPAMGCLIADENGWYLPIIGQEKRQEILEKSSRFLSRHGTQFSYSDSEKKAMEDKTNKELAIKALKLAMISDYASGKNYTGWALGFMEEGYMADVRSEKDKIRKEADEFIKNATPLIWIDPMYPASDQVPW